MTTSCSPQEQQIDPWILDNLVCPSDFRGLRFNGTHLYCDRNHKFRVLAGIPIMLTGDNRATHPIFDESIKLAKASDDELESLLSYNPPVNEIEEYVQGMIGATNGSLYNHLRFKLNRYPIPELRLPDGEGKVFLELGCNWGRWCISASRKGYNAIGIDPSFQAVWAASRVAKQLNAKARYIVGDARYLPFPQNSIDRVFSYSVLQHLEKRDVLKALAETQRVLRERGECLNQLPNRWGLLNMTRQLQRRFKKPSGFDVRYWSPAEMLITFSRCIGPTVLSVDGFFTLNAQRSERDLLKTGGRAVVVVSDALRKLSNSFRPFVNAADSIYVSSQKIMKDPTKGVAGG